jgi:hypothetical protein
LTPTAAQSKVGSRVCRALSTRSLFNSQRMRNTQHDAACTPHIR